MDKVEKVTIENFEGVYEPAEDSWLMVEYLPLFKGSVLEIGCGSGIISINLAKRGNQVTAVDINPKAIESTKINSKKNNVELEIIEGDMFSKLKNRKFDTIVCNPPYLPPTDRYDDPELSLAVEGGATGTEFTLKLLKEANNFGINIVDVRIKRADLPPANSEAIYKRMQTEREREAKEFRAQGAEIAQKIRSTADKDVTVILAQANKKSEIMKGEGDGERNKIFANAFGRDPQFFAFYRAMQAYEKALIGGETSLVLSPDSDFFKFFGDTGVIKKE